MVTNPALTGSTVETSDGPWLVLRCNSGPRIRLDARILDRIVAADSRLFLVVGEATIAVSIVAGSVSAAEIAAHLAAYTRSATIRNQEVYDDAKRRLALIRRGRKENGAFAFYLDDLDLFVDEEDVYLGESVVGRTSELIKYVENAADYVVIHPRGTYRIQAAFALLVLAASLRPPEDPLELERRLRQYEAMQADQI